MSKKVSELNQVYPFGCDVLRQVRKTYAGWNYTVDNGYIVYNKNSVRIYEHRAVAELSTGGFPTGHHIHHINEKPLDNRAKNLLPLSVTEHGRLHASRFGRPRLQVACASCGKKFFQKHSQLKRIQNPYCSVRCSQLGSRKVKRPSRAELAELLEEHANFCALGRLFGVSDNAVRRWCRYYGLPYRTRDLVPPA